MTEPVNLGKSVRFACGALELEGWLESVAGPDAVIITHPHPLYGGEMHNPVAVTLAAVYRQLGYTTLRFNFRGVGASEGAYDDGRGESDDVRAAAAYLAGLGKTVTDLAGYSFGAWVNLRLNPPIATVRRQLLVAPPAAFIEFGVIAEPPPELLVITGDGDRIAPPALLREQAPHWHPHTRLFTLPDADHFYSGALERLATLAATTLAFQTDGLSSGAA